MRRQSNSKFKSVEWTLLAVILSLSTSCCEPVVANEDNSQNAASAQTAPASEPMVEGGGDSKPAAQAPSNSQASAAPAENPNDREAPTLAPAQAPTLAPEQPATSQENVPVSSTPSSSPNDLVMQAPQMAMDPALASAYSNRLAKMEEIAFGASYAEHELTDRIDHLEEEIFKSKNSGAPDSRISKLEAKVFGQSAFAGGSQAPRGGGYPPIASVNAAGSGTPPYGGGNTPPVIIPGAPSQQSPSQLQPYQQVHLQPPQQQPPAVPYQTQAPYQPLQSSGSAPYPVQPYQGTRPNTYPNQNPAYGSYAPNTGRPQYAPNYTAPPNNSYPYGNTQPYQGANYSQYPQYRPQQPQMPQQPYTQPYQQYPTSSYPNSQYPATQYPPPQYPQSQYPQSPQSQYPQSQYPSLPQTQTAPSATPPPVQPVQAPSAKNSAACEKVAMAIPSSSKDGDYFANIRHFASGTSMHWQTFPVIVRLPKDCPESWRRALDGDIKKWGQYLPLQIAKGDDKAKIDVQWVNKLPSKILGVTRIEGSADDLKVTIFVLRPTFYPSEIPENVLQNVFAHELGHGLGLLGHSTNAGDVMYIRDDKQEKVHVASAAKPGYGSDKPSGRDLNTLKKLYNSAPLPSGFKLEQPLEYSAEI